MTKVIVHVDTLLITYNKTYQKNEPVISVTRDGRTLYAHNVEITGPCHVIHRPEKPLDTGAVCWIETHFPVTAEKWYQQSELGPYRPKEET